MQFLEVAAQLNAVHQHIVGHLALSILVVHYPEAVGFFEGEAFFDTGEDPQQDAKDANLVLKDFFLVYSMD